MKPHQYHKEKMMTGKQESKGIPLSAEQNEWLLDTDEEPNEQELEAHCMYTVKTQVVLHAIDDTSDLPMIRKTIKINNLKAQLQDKTIVNAEMRALLNRGKGKFVDTKFEKRVVVRKPNAFRFQKSSVLGKPFANSLEEQLFKNHVRFGNDQFAPILGYEDLVQGNVTIKRVYYVKGLNHNLFSVGQFCDADFKVAFEKSTCFVIDLQGNDLLMGNHGSNLYTIALQESFLPTLICFMAKALPTQARLWHHRISHLNFDTINLLYKNDIVNGLPKLKYVKDELYSSYEMEEKHL
nr:integrase, catalytic region, zinc finger, CCHC-type, peptidase aspartic, catalytic [Tanacetum cinerariifolium]